LCTLLKVVDGADGFREGKLHHEVAVFGRKLALLLDFLPDTGDLA
jgi:hypothetical protein